MDINLFESVNNLRSNLARAENLSVEEIEEQLKAVGFSCRRCGECCRGRSGDNSVIVYPEEITDILKAISLEWDEVCRPAAPLFVDGSGILHALEWELIRDGSGDCIFIRDDNTCSIYPHRPWICRTYPFYLTFQEGAAKPLLATSQCSGLGPGSSPEDVPALAPDLKKRLIFEIREEIKVLEKLKGHEDWKYVNYELIAGRPAKKGLVVHDSRGACEVIL